MKEKFYVYPLQALKRHEIAVGATAAADSMNVSAVNESNQVSDVSTPMASSLPPIPLFTNASAASTKVINDILSPSDSDTYIDKVGNCSGNKISDDGQDSSGKAYGTVATNTPTLIDSETLPDPQYLGLLSHPSKQPWRRIKLLVQSQIPDGTDSLQHITYTDSKDPFYKTRLGQAHT